MTNFAVQSTLGVAAPLVSKEKGSMGNRMDCAGAHIKNNAVTTLQTAAVGVTAYNAAKIIAKDTFGCSRTTKMLSKGFDQVTNLIGKIIKKPDFAKSVSAKIENLAAKIHMASIPKNKLGKFVRPELARRFKAAGVIAAIVLPALAYIAHNYSYKAGQIDQKYTDKAKFQKTL